MRANDGGVMTKGFVLCADDFAMTAGVSRSILALAEAGRVTATSVMSGFPHWRQFAGGLRALTGRIDVGLHLNLTLGAPLTAAADLAPHGRFLPIGDLAKRALGRRLDRVRIEAEIGAQLDALEAGLGRPPDFVDGHQHAHSLPVIREALVAHLARRYPGVPVYLRNPIDRISAITRRGVGVQKALAVKALGAGFAGCARRKGLDTNEGFGGFSPFDPRRDYGEDFARFLVAPGPRHLVMCHPGEIDDELMRLDPVVATRPLEAAFLASPRFLEVCHAADMEPRRFLAL